MDNSTGTTCKKCKAMILYDNDAPKPELCPVCENAEVEENDKCEYCGDPNCEDWGDPDGHK